MRGVCKQSLIIRTVFFGPEFMDYPRRELLDNVAGRDNIQLLVSRQIGTENWRHAFVADGPARADSGHIEAYPACLK